MTDDRSADPKAAGPVAGQSRAETIADGLRAQILDGKYGPGDRLPSERDLSERLGVNRSSVREALKKLEHLGMIAIRPGGGARVVPLQEAGLGVLRHALRARKPNRDLVAQWLDVHEIVVAGAARFAVERGTKEEFAEAKRLLRRLVSPSTTADEFVATADQLTDLIAIASRNVVLRMVRNGLTAAAAGRHDVRKKLRNSRKALAPVVADIERALDRRDAVGAEESVRRLLRAHRDLVLDLVAGPSGGN
jgi:GntR family transcriptional regulator, transcriptional repressor for pyruvate dehydrogenase complex